ncbi:MAG: DNA alkylation repair protein [Sphingobacteriaceae bacterium]
MTANEILIELEKYGDAQTKKTLSKHGAKEPFFGVKVADLKTILKKTKKNHELSLELYRTGNSDAMYLAGLMANENKITESQLDEWIDKAYWYYLSEFAVPWVAAETNFGFKLGMKWIQSDQERVASAGWVTLAYYAGVNSDENLDINAYSQLLDKVANEIHLSQNRVRHAMNGFVIAIGTYIKDLTDKASTIAGKIGKVNVDMNGTACKVPLATEYIHKAIENGQIGKKRKMARC